MILLSEWNDGALLVIMAMLLLPAVAIFFSIMGIMRLLPDVRNFLDHHKKEHRTLYYLALILLFIACIFITIGGYSLYLGQ